MILLTLGEEKKRMGAKARKKAALIPPISDYPSTTANAHASSTSAVNSAMEICISAFWVDSIKAQGPDIPNGTSIDLSYRESGKKGLCPRKARKCRKH